MRFAYLAALRATCPRKHVGAVIVDPEHRQVSTGYNGAPPDQPSCDDVGCQMVDNHCVRTLHAESNALDYAGTRLARNCTLYVTVLPCWDCAKRIVGARIARVVYDEHYESRYGQSANVPAFLEAAGVKVEQFDPERMTRFKSFLFMLDTPIDLPSTVALSSKLDVKIRPESCAVHRFSNDDRCVVCGVSGKEAAL